LEGSQIAATWRQWSGFVEEKQKISVIEQNNLRECNKLSVGILLMEIVKA
jgi:hypothetical protein